MRKLATVAMAAMISVNASAVGLLGTGNDNIRDAREYMKAQSSTDGSGIDWQAWGLWMGSVAGVSAIFIDPEYPYAICYPSDATAGQLAEVAAKFLIDNPAKRAMRLESLIWTAHKEAWDMQADSDCWLNDEWKEAQLEVRAITEGLLND